MPTFDTTIHRVINRSALELLARANDEDVEDPVLTEIVDIYVEVTYEPGYFLRGNISGPPEDCFPDEGEDPEITKVMTLDDNGNDIDITDSLSNAERDELSRAAWDDQADHGDDSSLDDADDAYEAQQERKFFGDDY